MTIQWGIWLRRRLTFRLRIRMVVSVGTIPTLLSLHMTMTVKTSHEITVTLNASEWASLSCLLSVHNQQPVMSPHDTAVLEKIRIKLNGALEADVHPYDAARFAA